MENKLKSGSCDAMENEEIAVDLNEDANLVFNVKGVEFKMIRVDYDGGNSGARRYSVFF